MRRALGNTAARCSSAVYEDKKLRFAGRVRTGFSDKLLRSLYSELEKTRIDKCPFFNLPAAGRIRLEPGVDRRRDETLPMGQIDDSLRGKVHGMDTG